MAKKTSEAPRSMDYILNCLPSTNTDTDWGIADAIAAEKLLKGNDARKKRKLPNKVDLRKRWWKIRDQGQTGSCVGFGVADGVLRWHYVKKGLIKGKKLTSPRFIWMADKETDNNTRYATTFLESAGTNVKHALVVAQKYGCVMENHLPMKGKLSRLKTGVFYGIAGNYRIKSYHNLGRNLADWREWIANNGPVLVRLNVDKTWRRATKTKGMLKKYVKSKKSGGHAVSLVGYTKKHFIVRNSWGDDWGDAGFGYASNEYAKIAFTEAYGVVMQE